MKNRVFFLLIVMPFLLAAQSDSLEMERQIYVVDTLIKAGKYAEALAISGPLKSKLSVNKNDQWARIAHEQAKSYSDLNELDRAIIELQEVETYWRSNKDTLHEEFTKVLNNSGTAYAKQKEYDKALSQLKKANEIRMLISKGKPSMLMLKTYETIAYIHRLNRDWSESIEVYQQVLFCQETILGKDHPEYVKTMSRQAYAYKKIGYYEKATSLYHKCLKLQQSVPASNKKEYILNTTLLAIVYEQMGEYSKTEHYFNHAIEHLNNASEDSLDNTYIYVLESYGSFLLHVGQYDKAELLIEKAMAIRERIRGKDNYSYASSLSTMGNFYMDIGDYINAEKYYLEALNLRKKTEGKESVHYAANLNDLANVYIWKKEYKKAEPYFIQAINVYEEITGKDHPTYAACLQNLAILYTYMKAYEKAEPLYLRSQAIKEKFLGKEHPGYVSGIMSLGFMFKDKGDLEKSESFFLQALEILNKSQFRNSELHRVLYAGFVALYLMNEEFEKAEPVLLDWHACINDQLTLAFSFLSESEKVRFLKKYAEEQVEKIQSAALNIHTIEFLKLQYNIALRNKGLRLQSGVNTMSYVLNQKDTSALDNYLHLQSIRRRLYEMYKLPNGKYDEIDRLEAQQKEKEKALARLSAKFRKEQIASNVRIDDVQQMLKADEAAIEFIHFRYRNPKFTDSILYAALVLLPNRESPYFVPLFNEKQLEQFLKNNQERRLDYVDQLYTFKERGFKPKADSEPSLFDLIWQPIAPLLKNIRTVYYSPTGSLYRLNLEAIPISESGILADKYKMRYLSSTRQLVLSPKYEDEMDKDAVVYGAVEYNYDSLAMERALKDRDSTLLLPGQGIGFSYTNRSHRGGQWNFLKWTTIESEAILTLLKENDFHAIFKNYYEATEESFKQFGVQKKSPKVIHMATHGFFFPDPVDTLKRLGYEPTFKLSDHPMIRSGLILAGANHVWEGNDPIPGREDGILTAYEISQLNLTNTELVVLSACETGLGDIQGNEGVFGLQRAFKMAGVRYLIMSLWQVPDFQTQELMVAFYNNWLEEKMDIPDAFRTAQQSMREKYQNPYFWAGFVLIE